MVMHRALFTWFILLIFFILLCLRLEGRTHWNWFIIFLPMWLYDVILLLDALFKIVVSCLHDPLKDLVQSQNVLSFFIVASLIVGQVMLCLKLEYKSLELQLIHVLIPFWIMLPLLIVGVSITLFKSDF